MEFPIFNQQDPRWANAELGTGKGYSMGRYSCALCCVCSVVNYYGRGINPLDLNAALVGVGAFAFNGTTNSDGTHNNTLVVWGKIAQLYGEILLKSNIAYPTTPADMNMIDAYLVHRQPVIVGVSFIHDPKAQTPSHYVVIYHKNDDGTYMCFDPWFGDRVVFDSRYAVNGMSVGNAILQVVIYSGPVPQESIAQAPVAAQQQQAVTPVDTATKQAQDNWNLYLQEVEQVKKASDRIVELEGQLSSLTDANTKLTTEISKTKELNSNLAKQLSQIESEDSTAIEEGLKAQDQLKAQQEIVHTVSGVLKTKPTMKEILSEIDSLFMKLRFAKEPVPLRQTTPSQPQPAFERVDPLTILGLKRG